MCFTVSLCAQRPVPPVGETRSSSLLFTAGAGVRRRRGLSLEPTWLQNDHVENTMTERNGPTSRAEVVMREGGTEGRAEKERGATRPGPGADAAVGRRISQECARSSSTFSSRCVGIVGGVGRVGG